MPMVAYSPRIRFYVGQDLQHDCVSVISRRRSVSAVIYSACRAPDPVLCAASGATRGGRSARRVHMSGSSCRCSFSTTFAASEAANTCCDNVRLPDNLFALLAMACIPSDDMAAGQQQNTSNMYPFNLQPAAGADHCCACVTDILCKCKHVGLPCCLNRSHRKLCCRPGNGSDMRLKLTVPHSQEQKKMVIIKRSDLGLEDLGSAAAGAHGQAAGGAPAAPATVSEEVSVSDGCIGLRFRPAMSD